MAREPVTFFRADKRSFERGDRIRTAGEFVDLHPEAGKQAEALLEQHRPEEKPTRRKCLMLFDNEEDARNYCSKMSGGRLYSVSVAREDVLHIGDMEIVNQIARCVPSGSNAQLAIDYWRGVHTQHACIEILVSEGIIAEILDFTQSERTERIRKLYGFRGMADKPDPSWDIFNVDPDAHG